MAPPNLTDTNVSEEPAASVLSVFTLKLVSVYVSKWCRSPEGGDLGYSPP